MENSSFRALYVIFTWAKRLATRHRHGPSDALHAGSGEAGRFVDVNALE